MNTIKTSSDGSEEDRRNSDLPKKVKKGWFWQKKAKKLIDLEEPKEDSSDSERQKRRMT